MAIPLLLLAGAILTGGLGAKKVASSMNTMDKAKALVRSAQNLEEAARNNLNATIKASQASVETLGKRKITIMKYNMRVFVELYGKLRNVALTDLADEGLLDFTPQGENFKSLQQTAFQMKELAAGTGAGLVSGAAAAAGAYGLVGMVGAASTGTAISTLSGVAATNATLAWLGGGSLAAGGFGVAGGMLVLGGLVAAPALMLGGLALNNKAEKAMAKAQSYYKKAERYKAEYEKQESYYQAVGDRADQITDCLIKLDSLLDDQLEEMRETMATAGTNWRNYSPEDKGVVIKTATLAKGIRTLLDVPLCLEDGALTEESELALLDAQELLY